MNSETILDYAQFQLSPRRTRCELFVSGGGKIEKLASGFLKPFLAHLKVAEEQANQAVQSIKLEVEKRKNAGTWFNKGTLERFVRFVSTPEVLELVNTYDAEMSQLEGARKIYSQGAGDQLSGENESAAAAAADITKKELLRAMDVRLTAVKQDLATTCARASAAGFTLDTVSELLFFADRFGALRLNEACTKFISLCQRQPELISHQRSPPPLIPSQWKGFDDANVRSSSSSDMSIDEPEAEVDVPFRQSISGTSGTGPRTLMPTSAHPIEKSAADIQPSVRPLMEKDTSKTKGDPSPSVVPSDVPVQPPAAGSRRLSVQDRIHLFESKHKEQSGSASISSSGSGGGGINKAVAGKGEHRRLPSDASMEKSVLRRWSGASDMSIDLTNNSFSSDKKECGSAAGTPTSSAHSQVQSESKIEEGAGLLKDTAASWPKFSPKDNLSTTYSSSSLSSSQTQIRSFPKDKDGVDDVLLKEVTTTTYKTQSGPSMEKAYGDSLTQFGTSMGEAHQGGFSDETYTLSSSKPASESGEGGTLKEHTASLTYFNEVATQNIGMKDQATSEIPSRAVPGTLVKAEPKDQAGADAVGQKSQAPSTTKFGTFAGKTEVGGAKPKDQLDSQFQSKASSGKERFIPQSNLPSLSQWKTYSGNQEAGRKEEATASHMSLKVSSEDSSGSQRMQLHGRTSAPDQMKKLQGRRDERLSSQGTSIPVFSVKKTKEQDRVLQLPSNPEQAQVARPLKGNSELNDELQMKADELEKLFAAHKLRVHGDQTASSRRSKTIEGQVLKSAEKRPVEVFAEQFSEGSLPSEVMSNGMEFDANLVLKKVDNLHYANSMKQKLASISSSDNSRGKLYERYMQKRDAKLREEWGSKRAQKEAKMKAMHDSLERSQEEMKAKLAGSSDEQDSVFARRRAEKMRSFNLCSAIKNQGQTVDPLLGEGEDPQELDQVLYGQDISYSDTLSGNESSSSSKRLVSSKSLSSSTPRTSAASIPKPSAKATYSSSIRRRTQPENPLAQSVPNFSDLRKENTKPVTGVSKVTSRTQPGTFTRSNSATEEANLVKEEKSRRSHSMRKGLAIPGELKDLSPLSSDGANLTSLKFPKEQMEQCINKIQKSGELKPFLRKGNGIGPGTGAGLSKLRPSTNCEALNDDEDSEGLIDQQEDSPDMVKDYEEEFDKTSAEGNLQTPKFPVESDGDNGGPGSENGDVVRSLSQDVDNSIAVSSKFNLSAGNVLESPGESPGSWNSNIHHTFSYAHEASDVDASVDSLTGSPTSWNPHPSNHLMVADAARMRKKWGSAQIPVLVANAPHQPRKDVTKGFKRLLKFGRKSKGADCLVNDWVSASTASEGDDDTEDGRELGSRTSDELRKSRMGYSVAAYDGFNDGGNFPEQAPRSFFSLSSFRSKGSEAKPR